MNFRRWASEHSLKLLAIRDTPQAIAGGVAIGIFFGFVPVIGLKTLLAIAVAWVSRSNVLAAVLAATAHEILFPLMPLIYGLEFAVGKWLLSSPHQWPSSLTKLGLAPHEWWTWKTLKNIGPALLVGSMVCSTPCALAGFFVTRRIVAGHQRKKAEEAASAIEETKRVDLE